MKIHTLVLGELDTNTYIIELDNELIVIDPAKEGAISDKARELNKPIKTVLLTHGHFDHCNGARRLQAEGARVLMSETDFDMIKSGYDLAKFCNVEFNSFTPEFIGEGTLEIGEAKIDVIATPGHTAGSLTYVIGDKIFSGDVIFYLGIGRSDLPTGDGKALIGSIKRLFMLDGTVYPGHGQKTSIEFERKHSVYVR